MVSFGDDINYLVEIDAATGKVAVDQTFMHNAAPDATVEAMAVSPDGERLYIGGAFKTVDDKPQYASVAALDARTGQLIEGWVPPTFSGSFVDRQGTPSEGEAAAVNALAVPAGGQHLLVGGEWVHVGSGWSPTYDPHSGLAALNSADGSIADWRPRNDRPVFGMALSPDGTKVCAAVGGAGGGVTCVQPGEEWPVFHTGKGPDTPDMNAHELLDRRIAHVDGDVLAVTVSDQRIYIGGHFDVEEPDPDADCLHVVPSQCFPGAPRGSMDSTPHKHLVAYALDGKEDPSWTAQVNTPEGPTVLLAGPQALYLGGNFTRTLDRHPSGGCWPCTEKTSVPTFFHPGFALFPAVN